MSLESLKSNIEKERQSIEQLDHLLKQHQIAEVKRDRLLLANAMASTLTQIKILNDSIPKILENIYLIEDKPIQKVETPKKQELINVGHSLEGSEEFVTIKKKDRKDYIKQLHILDISIRNLKKKKKKKLEFQTEYKKPNFYVKLSNSLFSNLSNKLINKGRFRGLKKSLKKGDFLILLTSYISMIFFTSLISIFFAVIVMLFFLFFSLGLETPFISLVDFSETSIFIRLLQVIWIIPLIPIFVFLVMLYYPSTEKSTLEQKIDYELPFAAIQMSAIAGANLEPSNIFRIIALSKDYPSIQKEAKKLLNQINLYGYDLVNALRNSAMASPSKNWADLLNGISTTIRSGGSLALFLNKRAEILLFEYRLKMEKAIRSAETLMNIYISVVIAAPMLLMLLLVMMNISCIGFSFSILVITVIIVSVISLINIVFLGFLFLRQKGF